MYCVKHFFRLRMSSGVPKWSLCQIYLVHSHSVALAQSVTHTAVSIQRIIHARFSIAHVLTLMALNWQHTSAFWQRSAGICHHGDRHCGHLLSYSLRYPQTRFNSWPLTGSGNRDDTISLCLSLICSILYLLDLSQLSAYICCPAWLLLSPQHKRKWQLPFIPSIQSCWTQEMLSQDNRIQLPNGMCRLSNAVRLPFSIGTDRYTVRGTKSLSIWVLWVKLRSKALCKDSPPSLSTSTSLPFPLLCGISPLIFPK